MPGRRRSRLTYNKIIADQQFIIDELQAKIARLNTQVTRLKAKIARVTTCDEYDNGPTGRTQHGR